MDLNENQSKYTLQERIDMGDHEPIDIRDLKLAFFFGLVVVLAAYSFKLILSM